MSEQVRWVATYERVSSDDQRDRETIKTQTEILDQYLGQHPELKVFRRYRDDGVSGTIPVAERPEGGPMVRDAVGKHFSALIVTRPSRLGRDRVDRLQVYDLFERIGVANGAGTLLILGPSQRVVPSLEVDLDAVDSSRRVGERGSSLTGDVHPDVENHPAHEGQCHKEHDPFCVCAHRSHHGLHRLICACAPARLIVLLHVSSVFTCPLTARKSKYDNAKTQPGRLTAIPAAH